GALDITAKPINPAITSTDLADLIQDKPYVAIIVVGNELLTSLNNISFKNKPKPPTIALLYHYPQKLPATLSIILRPDPVSVLSTMNAVAPSITQFYIISTIPTDNWYVKQIQTAADSTKHQVVVKQVEQSAIDQALAYRSLLKGNQKIAADHSAIWIISAMDKAILADILKSAWFDRIIVIANFLPYVQHGVTFGFFTDNQALGRQINTLTLQLVTKNYQGPSVIFSAGLKTAIHTVAAKRIAPQMQGKPQAHFDLVLPQ
ncbi:MAG: hypothetical protein V3T17_19865, partial [Pseudomonadales bacterium]